MFKIYIRDLIDEKGKTIQSLTNEISQTDYENMQLEIKIDTYESFHEIASEAAHLGFLKNDEIYLLK